MRETTVELAQMVAEGAGGPVLKRFQAAVSLMGYQGVRGVGITNRTSGERTDKSWKALAERLLDEMSEKVEAEPEPEPTPESKTEITYLYETRTPFVPLSVDTRVQARIKTEMPTLEKGPCEINRWPGCTTDYPQDGIHRTLPLSLLPGAEPECAKQCLECYEDGAEEYIKTLHGQM